MRVLLHYDMDHTEPGLDIVGCSEQDDARFHALLPDDAWGRLPLAVWRRFSKRLAGGRTIVYVGEVEDVFHSRAGWWLAWVGTRLLSRSSVVHYDGPLSVQGAYTAQEALDLAQSAGLGGAAVQRRWPCRWRSRACLRSGTCATPTP